MQLENRVRWYRSLYWRIALGYVVSIALILIVQWIIFIELADYRDQANEAERQDRLELTRQFGKQISARLEDSQGNIEPHLAALETPEHVFVILREGRVIGSRHPSPSTVRLVVEGLERIRRAEDFPDAWARGDFGGAPVTLNGEVIGALGIMPPTTFERYDTTIISIALLLMILGTVVLSLIVVAPIRARLGDLQAAAARLRDGDLQARADPRGGDEIANVGQVFNEMADELSRRTTELETSDRLRRQLIADVSHELMTPLTAVLGHLETLSMEEVDLDKEARSNQVSIASREAHRLERLIGDLLNSARLENGAAPLEIEEVCIRTLFNDVLTRHEHECRSRNITATCSVAAGAETIRADRFRLEQVIENLFANATRHTRAGGLINLKAEVSGDVVSLQVEDSGEGIAPEHLPYVFDRFYKASSADGIASPGSGLGLSIVKAIVTRHGGRVSASSTVGHGTAVTVELPVNVAGA
jgi:signal transduction histidine kinase